MEKFSTEIKYEECRIYENILRMIHDISSPIATIEMGLFDLSQDVQSETITIIKSALQRIREICHSLHPIHYPQQKLMIMRGSYNDAKDSHRHKSCSLNLLIENIIAEKKLEWCWGECDLTFTCFSDENNSNINADPVEIKRVISNLLNNARDAIFGFGKINVELRKGDCDICISISDNGIGIEDDKIHACLNGVSYKHAGQGLGLSGAKDVIESIGGVISVVSQVGKGTTVELRFSR